MFRLIKGLLRFLVLLLLIASLLFCYARYVEPHLLTEKEFSVKRSETTPGEALTVVAFADTHFSEFYTPEDFSRVVSRINAMKPDFVFFLGDLIDNYNIYEGDTALISSELAAIESRYGKFAVFGNHDYGGGLENYYEDIMKTGGFQVLLNNSLAFPDLNVTLLGIDDVMIGYGDPSCASTLTSNSYNIVLAHEPDIASDMTAFDIDLMLSGHSHGGQVNLPFAFDLILPPYGRTFVKGDYTFDNQRKTQLYVNSGLGTTQMPLRFLVPPEITKITIE